MFRYVLMVLMLWTAIGNAVEMNNTKPSAVKTKIAERIVIGRVERIKVMAVDITKKARIDTGAKTTSIDAREIEPFIRDGKDWVRFKFDDEPIEAPVARTVLIKRHGGKSRSRFVVELDLKLGPIVQKVEVTLANREKYVYPILIGRNFLKNQFVVDVTRVFLGCSSQKVAY